LWSKWRMRQLYRI